MKNILPVIAVASLLCTVPHVNAQAPAAANTPPMPQITPVPAVAPAQNPVVVIETSMGRITAELWQDRAPGTVKNFLSYADKKFYEGTIFHRMIPNFMAQCGGFTPDMKQKKTGASIKNEASAKSKNARGTLAMARTRQVDSATSQFFINLVDNTFLDHKNKSAAGYGYCAFGKVIDGMAVVDAMAKVQTGVRPPHRDVPVESIMIKSVTRKAADS